MWPPVVIRRFGIIHENKLLFAKMCEEMRVTMKKGKQKNNATTRAGRKEELTAYLCLIPAFLGVSLISYLPERHYEAGIYRACQFPAYFYERYLFLGFYQSNCMVCFSGGDRCRGILTDHSDPLKHEYKRQDIVPLPVLHPVSAAGHRRI